MMINVKEGKRFVPQAGQVLIDILYCGEDYQKNLPINHLAHGTVRGYELLYIVSPLIAIMQAYGDES